MTISNFLIKNVALFEFYRKDGLQSLLFFNKQIHISLQPIELPIMDGNVFHVSIANCNNVVIVSNFLVNTYGLRSISFTNLRNLTLQQSALSFPQLLSSTRLIIDFNNVTIKEIQSHAFNGNIDEITFTSTQIDLIRPFAFTAFRDKAYFIKFIDTVFKLVEPQVRYLHIKF